MNNKFLLVPGFIHEVKTLKDRTVQIVCRTMTELTPEEMTQLFALNRKEGVIGFGEGDSGEHVED